MKAGLPHDAIAAEQLFNSVACCGWMQRRKEGNDPVYLLSYTKNTQDGYQNDVSRQQNEERVVDQPLDEDRVYAGKNITERLRPWKCKYRACTSRRRARDPAPGVPFMVALASPQ